MTDPLLKTAAVHSADPAQLTGYIWPVNHAFITTRFAPEAPTDGGFVMIDGVAYHDGIDLATHCDDKSGPRTTGPFCMPDVISIRISVIRATRRPSTIASRSSDERMSSP